MSSAQISMCYISFVLILNYIVFYDVIFLYSACSILCLRNKGDDDLATREIHHHYIRRQHHNSRRASATPLTPDCAPSITKLCYDPSRVAQAIGKKMNAEAVIRDEIANVVSLSRNKKRNGFRAIRSETPRSPRRRRKTSSRPVRYPTRRPAR